MTPAPLITTAPLTQSSASALLPPMETPDDEPSFLRDLVKASRQRTEQVSWTDRDGCARRTALTPVESARLALIARRGGISPGEVLRRAAHIPVPKPAAGVRDLSHQNVTTPAAAPSAVP